MCSLLAVGLMSAPAAGQGIRISEGEVGAAPQEYIVEEGDTLWDICDRFFRQPWYWPTVWALNPHVTNPHWIYPGDVLRLRTGEVAAAPRTGGLVYVVGAAGASHFSTNKGFIAEEPLKVRGTVRWSFEEVEYLAQDDQIYVEFENLDEVRIGQQYTIFSVVNDVYHPKSGKNLGQKIEVHGIAEIRRVDKNVATAEIIKSFSELTRGAKVTDLLDHYHSVSPRQNLIDLDGTIVDRHAWVDELGEFHTVYIDRGAKDGVQVGNRFFVMRRDDGFLKLRQDDESDVRGRLPWEQIGEALIVETHDRTATAIVTRSARELHVGDRVTMQRHY